MKTVSVPPLEVFSWTDGTPKIPPEIKSLFNDADDYARVWTKKIEAIERELTSLTLHTNTPTPAADPGGPGNNILPDFTVDPPQPLGEVVLPEIDFNPEENICLHCSTHMFCS